MRRRSLNRCKSGQILPFCLVIKYQNNAETIAAMREARDIAADKTPSKSYNSVAELMEDLNSDDED